MRRFLSLFLFFAILFSTTRVFAQTKNNDKFEFTVAGCIHFGVSNPKDWELTVYKINQNNPDFVVFLGGMVDPMSPDSVESLWADFSLITDNLGKPTYNVPGDCRIRPFSIPQDRLGLMKKLFLDKYKKLYQSFEYKNNLFILLDSDGLLDKIKGLIPGEQLDFLKRTIINASSYNNVFIFLHRSFWLEDDSDWFKTIHPLIKGKVKYVFGANKHFIDYREVDGVNYVASGFPPCGIERPEAIKPQFPHVLQVKVDKNKVSIDVIPTKIFFIPIERMDNIGREFNLPYMVLSRAISRYDFNSPERAAYLPTAKVVKSLNISPGMTILDIGAGSGLFSFLFADELAGTGMVFATEIDPSSIEYIKDKMAGRYNNILPVRVQREGLDLFYKQHSFDLIFLCRVYQGIDQPEHYFRELRPSLAKDTGRLYIITPKTVFGFDEIDFEGYKNVVYLLRKNGEGFPVFDRLSRQIQDFIRSWQGGDVPSDIRIKITRDFNMMLSDRFLFNDLSRYYIPVFFPTFEYWINAGMYPEDNRLCKWLIGNLRTSEVFDKNKENITDIDKRELSELNKILLCGIFRIGRLSKENLVGVNWEKPGIISTMKAAGYQFVREYDFLTRNYFFEFKRID
ncbi:MAG: methyltransferase [Candidatus Omnitrophota bacterium]|nr:methyltransferase [Candidatus Omnitrophota bacterium]